MNVLEHVEEHLGTMQRGWSSSTLPRVQICAFPKHPSGGLVTLATLGLSDQELDLGDGQRVRQELLLVLRKSDPIEEGVRILMHCATWNRALLRGELIEIGEPMTGSIATSLYVSVPVVFPDELAALDDTEPTTVFVWLIPILPEEAKLVRDAGWNAFEDQLVETQPDLYDWMRPSML